MTHTTSTSEQSTHEERPSGRHPVNVAHLVMGVAFLGMVAVWALYETGVVETGDLRWFLPVPWLAAGLAGIAAMTFGPRRTTSPDAGWVPPTVRYDYPVTTESAPTTDTTQEER